MHVSMTKNSRIFLDIYLTVVIHKNLMKDKLLFIFSGPCRTCRWINEYQRRIEFPTRYEFCH